MNHEQILVIEDEPEQRTFLKRALGRKGYQITLAANGASGLHLFERQAPDLVLLDIMLPDIDGWAVCRRLRTESNVPVIMLTALGRTDDIVQGLDIDADDYLVKPLVYPELLARVRAALRRGGKAILSQPLPSYDEGQLRIDLAERTARVRNRPVALSKTEARLLACQHFPLWGRIVRFHHPLPKD